jgi:outer membrane protein TolC
MNTEIQYIIGKRNMPLLKKRYYRWEFLMLGIMMFFANISVYSQNDSLTYYLEIAARKNPTVLQRYNEYQAALQKVPQVGALPDPQLELGVFLSPMELISGNQVADIKLMQMFPWFGVLKNAKDEMSLMAKGKFEQFRDAKLQVYYDVQRTGYDLQKNRQQIRQTEKNLAILKTIERLSVVKFKTGGSSSSSGLGKAATVAQGSTSASSGMSGGMGGNSSSSPATQAAPMPTSNSMGASSGGSGLSDIYRIQIEMGELENNIALLKNQQNTLGARFNSYLNRPAQAVVSLPDSVKPDSVGMNMLSVSDSMFTRNPMLGMLRYEQQSLAARTKMVKQMGLPMVGLGLNYTVINKSEMSTSAMNGKDMVMPMLTVTLPIYRKKYKAMEAETKFMKIASEQNYQATTNGLQTEYFEALQLYQDGQRRMKLYDNQARLAQKSLDIMIKTFSSSGSGLTDLLRVRQQLLDYQFKQVEAVTDYNTAIAWIKRLVTAPNP